MNQTFKVSACRSLLLLAGVILGLGACTESPSGSSGSQDPSKRPKAPLFEATTLAGADLVLSELRGKVVLINFWATWCGPCRMEIPDLAKLDQSYRNQDLVVVGISLDSRPESYVRVEAEKMGATYPIVLAGEDGGRDWGGITAIPTTFLIDRQGRIAHRLLGYTPIERLVELVRPLLAEEA